METNKGKIFANTLIWGFALWLFGYILGMLFFVAMPKNMIGWAIMPFGIAFTLWVLFKKIKRSEFGCYIGLGIIWTLLAILLDYVFIVKALGSSDYYQFDVYLYYVLTLALPIAVGWYKKSKGEFAADNIK